MAIRASSTLAILCALCSSIHACIWPKTSSSVSATKSQSPLPWSKTTGLSLVPVRRNVWVAERPFKFFGLADCGTKMTVVKLRDGSLWLHSPVEMDADTKKAINKLGKVKHIVSPNFEHLRYAKMWIDEYKHAKSYAPKGVPAANPHIGFQVELGTSENGKSPWGDEIKMCYLDMERNIPFLGHPYFGEVVFFHAPSRTLISADTFWNVPPGLGLEAAVVKFVLDRMFMPLFRHVQCKRRLVHRLAPEVLGWDFTAIIPCHGRVVGSELLTPALTAGDRTLAAHGGDATRVFAAHIGVETRGVPVALRPWCWLAAAFAASRLKLLRPVEPDGQIRRLA